MDMLDQIARRNAARGARVYMIDAEKHIDEQFGAGFSKRHPELVGAFMLTAALDSGLDFIGDGLGSGITRIAEAIAETKAV